MKSRPLKQATGATEPLRFAPGFAGVPAAQFWKFWVAGDEVYATTRGSGGAAKISVHASGQIHMSLEGKDKFHLAPPLVFAKGEWRHAFELRFLLSADAFRPPVEDMKNKPAVLLDVPDGGVLVCNLLVGRSHSTSALALPEEFAGAQRLWQARTRNNRPVVLLGRLLEMDKANRDELAYIRFELTPKVNYTDSLPEAPYMEVRRLIAGPEGGNIVLIIPMGEEAFRLTGPAGDVGSQPEVLRRISLSSPSASCQIVAPNGAIVGTLAMEGWGTIVDLRKGETVRAQFGTFTLTMDGTQLMLGESFFTESIPLPCLPTIDGAQPRTWDYRVFSRFTEDILSVEVRSLSVGLRNANTLVPMRAVTDAEELIIAAPSESVTLQTSFTEPQSSASLHMSLLLSDI